MIFFTPCNSCILDNCSFPLTPNNFRSPSEHFLQVNTSKGGIGGTFPVDSELRFRRSKMTRILANSNQNWTLGLLSFIWWFFSPPVTRASFRTQASRLLKKIFGPLRNIFSDHVCLFLFFYFSIYIFGYLKVPRTTIGPRQVPLVFSLPIFYQFEPSQVIANPHRGISGQRCQEEYLWEGQWSMWRRNRRSVVPLHRSRRLKDARVTTK